MLSAAVTTPIAFTEWLELNPELKPENITTTEVERCDECNGTCEIVCPQCGEGTIECPECEGEGGFKRKQNKAKEIYEEELALEKRRLERFIACGTLPPIPGA